MAELTIEDFEEVVADTMERLDERFKARLDNVAIVVEEWPDRWTLQLAGVGHREQLLGFYHGVPLTERTQAYGMVTPDKISIYRQPLMRYYRTPEALREGIRHTVLHELAHYFGLSDDRLRELGAY
jgi:predicted Zn-dependent protease with MMP-like domain